MAGVGKGCSGSVAVIGADTGAVFPIKVKQPLITPLGYTVLEWLFRGDVSYN